MLNLNQMFTVAFKVLLHEAIFLVICKYFTQRRCETSCGRNCTCNPLSSKLVSQRKIALRVAGKVDSCLLLATLRDSLQCVTVILQLQESRNTLVIIALQVVGEIAYCNSAFFAINDRPILRTNHQMSAKYK